MTTDPDDGRVQVAFVCVENAGRSQMAAAFARRERAARGLDAQVDIVTGGTRPAEAVHPAVVETMQAVGVDISDRTPQAVTVEQLRESEYVVTMGCAAGDVCPAGWAGENRDWDLEDPGGRPVEAVARIRDDIERRVTGLFDELVGRE
jgi:arsenate reductase